MTDTDDQNARGPGISSSGLYFSMISSLQILTVPAIVFVHEEPDPNRSSEIDRDYDHNEIEWDLGFPHQQNAKLRQRKIVQEFFAKVKDIKSVWDKDAREWLRLFPQNMREEAIPLFESNIDGVLEDYQLYPCYSWLTQGAKAEDPDDDFYQLSDTELREYQNHLFLPLGRLFVNAANGNRFNERVPLNFSRVTRWTGYELFLADNLELWIVFDGHSLASPAPRWFPVPCGLTTGFEPGIACLLPSLSKLEHATFENARASMETTHQTSSIVKNDVEQSDVKELENEVIAQGTAQATRKLKPKADVSETPLMLAIEKKDKSLVKRLLEVGADVNHSNRRGQMPITLAVAKTDVGIVELLLNTGKVNIDLDTGRHQSVLQYASEIARSSALSIAEMSVADLSFVGLADLARMDHFTEMDDFLAGLEDTRVSPYHIAEWAKAVSSYVVLQQLQNYVEKHNLKFSIHKSEPSWETTQHHHINN